MALGGLVYALPLSDLPRTLTMVGLQSMLGGLFYLALFSGIAIGRRDREMYTSVVGHLLQRPRLAPAQV